MATQAWPWHPKGLRLGLVVFGTLIGACSGISRPVDRQAALQRWSQVRGSVKFQLAKQQYAGGLFDAAVETVCESLALDPSRVEAHVLLARAYLETDRPASARRVLAAARAAGLFSGDLLYTEGVVLEQAGKLGEAVERFSDAHAGDPSNVDFLVAYAESLVASGEADEALALVDRFVGRTDDTSTLVVLGAHIAHLLGRTEDAVRRLRTADVQRAGTERVAESLGLLLSRQGRCGEALTVLQPLLDSAEETEPQGAVRRAIATCHLALGEAFEARDVLAVYATAHPDDTTAQLLLAKAALEVNDLLTATYAVERAEQREPHHPEVLLARGVIQWQRGDLTSATLTLKNVLARSPDDVEALCLLGEILLAQRKSSAARRQFERALKLDPQCAWAKQAVKRLG